MTAPPHPGAAPPGASDPLATSGPEHDFYFGPADAPLFGCLHRPAAAGDAGAGHAVVLCSAFGSEELSAHGAWRQLAQRLARAGHWVLRFDYAGCGDSAGDNEAGDASARWVASVGHAIDELRRLSGRAQVVMLGLRLGAALAWQAAASRSDVLAWAGVAPVLSGRQYLRELQALQASLGLAEGLPSELGLESGGFVLNPATRTALLGLDQRAPRGTVPPHLALVQRPGRLAGPEWERQACALGAKVLLATGPGLEHLFVEPHRVVVPDSEWQTLVQWVAGLPLPERMGAATAPANGAPGHFDGLTEVPMRLNHRQLAAVLTHSGRARQCARLVLFLNAGATRRVGPGRFQVQLARTLAHRGDVAVRLDLPGLGDSPAAPGQAPGEVYAANAVADVVQVVNELMAHTSARECVLVGLCAGAYHGLKAAFAGAPVRQVVAINPLTFHWTGDAASALLPKPHEVIGEAARYRQIVFTLQPWLKLLRGQVQVRRLAWLLALGARRHLGRVARNLVRALGLRLRHDLGLQLTQASQRGVRFTFIFAEGEPGIALLQDQAGAAVQRLELTQAVQRRLVPQADHVFLNQRPREVMLGHLLGALGVPADGHPQFDR